MDTDRIINFLNDNEALLRSNNFDKLYQKASHSISSDTIGELSDFLLNVVGIPFLGRVNTIGKYWFSNNFSQPNVIVPENVKTIEEDAFYRNNLEKVILTGVSKIESGAFNRCFNLKTVEIDGDITRLFTNTFNNCTSLSFVYIPESVVSLGNGVFNNTNENIVIVTPWRDEKSKKLRIPNSEIEWYKAHLKFRHAPSNAQVDQEGEE